MSWQRDEFASHEGTVGVLLADGSESGPVSSNLGSGGHAHEAVGALEAVVADGGPGTRRTFPSRFGRASAVSA
ncbi:hypothetical protein [Streptomyces sp. NPDC058667]|uniref:hypothetical protein n=1 Tax=Streptomyces sp. NPDC058667 TaxID=3346588 RepID=UPI0036698FEF